MLFDTHAHLDTEQLADQTDEIIADANRHQVTRILTVSTTLASCYQSIRLADQYPGVYAAVGIHPNSCHETTPAQFREIASLIDHPRVIAIGETGLDDHWDFCPMEIQKEYFQKHIELSHISGLPFIVHMRDCEDEMLQTLKCNLDGEGHLNGVMHSFCGSLQAARQCLDWGMHISFAGMLTFRKNESLREIAREIPNDRLLIETDSPYLSPHPCRSIRPNTPALVRHTLQCLADVKGVEVGKMAAVTTENALRFFGIDV